ncbi:MAG TPA: hypothetical protein VNU48_00425 [Burkholderiaceae bacterium]|nr:hypothetical protein [Burkholderiaceae bacterium]
MSKLTKDDVRILRWACESQIAAIDANPSGDLLYEEEFKLLRALRNLPKVKELPPAPAMPDERTIEKVLLKAQRKRAPITVDYSRGALDLPRGLATAKHLMKKLDMHA